MTILTNAFVQVIVSTIWTNRARCTLYKKIFDLLEEESVSGKSSGRASLLIRREVLPRMFEKVSQSPKYDSNFFWSTNINIKCNRHQRRSLYPARATRVG